MRKSYAMHLSGAGLEMAKGFLNVDRIGWQMKRKDLCLHMLHISGQPSQTEFSAVSPQHIWHSDFLSRQSDGLKFAARFVA